MSLNNRISCVVVISIFGFNKYWHTVFNLMELNMSPTFKQFLQSETINSVIKIILPAIQWNKDNSLTQVGNDKTGNIQEHNFKAKWDALQSRNMISFFFCSGHRDQISCSLFGGFSKPRTAATQSLDTVLM